MRVLIVDDHAPFRAAARALLTAEGYDVVGEAADGETALRAAGQLTPDAILLDVQLPGIDGFEVAARLADSGYPGAVVLVSGRAPGRRLQDTPARGFIPKGELTGPALVALLG
ncbi:LytR/AlgR family response regulator transcription factor [Solirubrobacter soli]|uniref:LytR/AlgR family response regulator transcription factor n=1 Tax=Solirubrobacter soli TaxID=363832 RepID=UPI0005640967|nr:response regulator transcription factor [Solirubrobacter soli]